MGLSAQETHDDLFLLCQPSLSREHLTAKYLLLIFEGLCLPERGNGSLSGLGILFAEMSHRGVQKGGALL